MRINKSYLSTHSTGGRAKPYHTSSPVLPIWKVDFPLSSIIPTHPQKNSFGYVAPPIRKSFFVHGVQRFLGQICLHPSLASSRNEQPNLRIIFATLQVSGEP